MLYHSYFGNVGVLLTKESYANGAGVALQLWSYDSEYGFFEPYSMITVNLPQYPAPKDVVFIDVNNNPGAVEFIQEHRLGVPAGYRGFSGMCSYPAFKVDLEKIQALDAEARETMGQTSVAV